VSHPGEIQFCFGKIGVWFLSRKLMNEIMCDLETIVVVIELSRRE